MLIANTTKDKMTDHLSANAILVLEKRYLAKDDKGQPIETPDEMFRRVARNVSMSDLLYNKDADIEKIEEEFYGIMKRVEFLPNSPTLMNAGRELQQLSACFVLPIEDSMDSIFEAIKNTALIHKSGGGTGFSFSRLRPQNDKVKSTGGVASGPISFMKVFNSATEAVKQGGTRRGANMGILRVDHPDILQFIKCKQDDHSLNNFNISVGVTENFMKAVEQDMNYDLINPRTKERVDKLKAREVFDLVVEMAWKNGDPGIIFIDRLNMNNPTPHIGEIEATNPCGEQPLLPYEPCNLGSINLSKFVSNNRIDFGKLGRVVNTAVHFLDNVIDVNRYPIEKIEMMAKSNRKIGLGVMGFADMLIQLGIPYNSDDALQKVEEVMSFINIESKRASQTLASVRGTFPNYKGSIYDKEGGFYLRNSTTTTIAPTGTLSIIASCSSGIEPLFALSFTKNVMDRDELIEVNPYFEKIAKEKGFYSESLMKDIGARSSIQGIREIPDGIKKTFVVAHDISPEWHIKMQAAFQKYTDNAVSKTINLSYNATVEDIRDAYLYAFYNGCKGITVYRDGSREEQVLTITEVKSQKKSKAGRSQKSGENGKKSMVIDNKIEISYDIPSIKPRPRPKKTSGTTTKMQTFCGDLYVTINEDEDGRPFEVFCSMGKAGGCEGSQNEAVGRLISQALRCGIDFQSIIKQLIGIRCSRSFGVGPNKVESCSDAIAKVMLEYLNGNRTKKSDITNVYSNRKLQSSCPDCGCLLEFSEGCEKCHFCGFSRCY